MTGKSRRTLEALGKRAADGRDGEGADEGPSRTQRKNASRALTRLGEDLLTLSAERLAALDLPTALRGALAEAERLTSFGAKRRHAQLIGKLMRRLDAATVVAIRKALDRK
jgi:ribosome-associated protein